MREEGGGKRIKLTELHTYVVKMVHFYMMLGLTGREPQYKCLKPGFQGFQTSAMVALELDYLL